MEEAGNYWVRVTDVNGCKNADSISVSLLLNCDDIYLPSAFTPNDDGLNDKFGALGNLFLVSQYSFQIYNKLGQLVFVTNNPYQKWDGKMKASLPQWKGIRGVRTIFIKTNFRKSVRVL